MVGTCATGGMLGDAGGKDGHYIKGETSYSDDVGVMGLLGGCVISSPSEEGIDS